MMMGWMNGRSLSSYLKQRKSLCRHCRSRSKLRSSWRDKRMRGKLSMKMMKGLVPVCPIKIRVGSWRIMRLLSIRGTLLARANGLRANLMWDSQAARGWVSSWRVSPRTGAGTDPCGVGFRRRSRWTKIVKRPPSWRPWITTAVRWAKGWSKRSRSWTCHPWTHWSKPANWCRCRWNGND